jgi:NADPH2:quinone reductase
VAGDVVDVGSDAGPHRVGDRVVAIVSGGGYATEAVARAAAATPVPEGTTDVEAASIPVNFLTAWFCLFEMGNLRPGERVLVHGGAGGCGTAAVRLALDAGGTVFATAGSAEKVEFLRSLGVQRAIDYRREAFDRVIRDATDGEGVDLVLDAVGGRTLEASYRLLAPLGRVVSYGLSAAVTGERRNPLGALRALWRTPRFRPQEMIGRNVGVWGFHLGRLRGKEDRITSALQEIFARLAAGRIEPTIAATFPLTAAGAARAHRFIHERRNIGKVVLVAEGASEVEA